MGRKGKILGVGILAAALAVTLVGTAFADHNRRVLDGSNPDQTDYLGHTCSEDAVTPSGYQFSYNGYQYLLRYSANCRSVWERALNSASNRTWMKVKRLNDANGTTQTEGYCGDGPCAGSTYAWTLQVDDAGHQSKVMLKNPSTGQIVRQTNAY
jgi:hypothetical protein